MESPTHYYAVEEECWKKDFKRSGIGLWKKREIVDSLNNVQILKVNQLILNLSKNYTSQKCLEKLLLKPMIFFAELCIVLPGMHIYDCVCICMHVCISVCY